MNQPPAADADIIAYLVRVHEGVPSNVGPEFQKLHGEIVDFVSKLRRPYPDSWIWPVGQSFDELQKEAYRFRFDPDFRQLEERAAEAGRELDGFMKKVRALDASSAALPSPERQKAWSLVERSVELLPAEASRSRKDVGYTEELQHCLRLGRELVAKRTAER